MLGKSIVAVFIISVLYTMMLIVMGNIEQAGISMLVAFILAALYGYVNKRYKKLALLEQHRK